MSPCYLVCHMHAASELLMHPSPCPSFHPQPYPIPSAGIFGDPQLFALESRDGDTETRNFSPVAFNVSGSVDLVITPFDHGWCFGTIRGSGMQRHLRLVNEYE